jgi:hypothetical protein
VEVHLKFEAASHLREIHRWKTVIVMRVAPRQSMSGSPQRKRSRFENGTCCWSRERALSQACLPCVREQFAELSSHDTLSEAMELLHSKRSTGGDCATCLSHLLKIFPHEKFRSLQEDGGVRAVLRAHCSPCMAAFVKALGTLLQEPLNIFALSEVAVQEDEKLAASEQASCQHIQLLVAVLAQVVEPARVHGIVMYAETKCNSSFGLKWFLNFLLKEHGSLPHEYESKFHPLYQACMYGTMEVCSALLSAGVNPFELRDDGSSMLHAAASMCTDPKLAKRSGSKCVAASCSTARRCQQHSAAATAGS